MLENTPKTLFTIFRTTISGTNTVHQGIIFLGIHLTTKEKWRKTWGILHTKKQDMHKFATVFSILFEQPDRKRMFLDVLFMQSNTVEMFLT